MGQQLNYAMKETTSLASRINAPPKFGKKRKQRSNIRSSFGIQYALHVLDVFFCRFLLWCVEIPQDNFSSAAWQPYIAKYP